ncbi:unnamed protein product [Candidatus Protochlamydia amoebophila UWE25]|uniref:Uncharacterized protein n=2 Tax=Candidatus Protochlamydia amoebophila TaxID=362787 RepID=A0A2P9H9U2_PARUW|nr:unnamed protein product [Candidatus Protochlamydia amoebophila UWE25]
MKAIALEKYRESNELAIKGFSQPMLDALKKYKFKLFTQQSILLIGRFVRGLLTSLLPHEFSFISFWDPVKSTLAIGKI